MFQILQEVVQNFSKLSAVDRRELLLHKLHHDETRGLVYDISVKKSTGKEQQARGKAKLGERRGKVPL